MSLLNNLFLQFTEEFVEAAGLDNLVTDVRLYHTAALGQGVEMRVHAPYDFDEVKSVIVLLPETLAEYRTRLASVKDGFYTNPADFVIPAA